MPNLRLTRRTIDDLPYADSGQIFYRDTLLTGFGLRVGTQSKVYYAEGQVNRRTRRVTIGRADVVAPEIARKKAMALLAEMAEGLGSGLIDQSQKMTVAAMQMAEKKVCAHRS